MRQSYRDPESPEKDYGGGRQGLSHTIHNFDGALNRTAESVPQRALKDEYDVPVKLR